MKTRIETCVAAGERCPPRTVSEQHPWKQGLKPTAHGRGVCRGVRLRATSMKTRIETFPPTQIHTLWRVSEQHPWKQGLKHRCRVPLFSGAGRLRATSMKTRIETHFRPARTANLLRSQSNIHENKDWNLRYTTTPAGPAASQSNIHENKDWNAYAPLLSPVPFPVSEQHPWKQGLKHSDASMYAYGCIPSQSNIHENKDWNTVPIGPPRAGMVSQSNIHENKDWNIRRNLG